MKKIISIFAAAMLASGGQAQTNTLYGSIADMGMSPLPGVAVTMTLVSPNPKLQNGVWVSTGKKVQKEAVLIGPPSAM